MNERRNMMRVGIAILLLICTGTSHAATPWTEEAQLTAAADGKMFDTFGWSVAVSGDTAIVAAKTDDVTTVRNGSAYIFVRIGKTWSRQARLTASDASPRDLFGSSVAISGNTAIVGALGSNNNLGATYVFVRTGTTWSQQKILTAPITVTGDQCGFSVAISGDTAVLGCKNNNLGAVYVFVRSGTAWTLQGTLTASNSAAGDLFGWSVAISGGTVVVGALGDKLGGPQGKGSATVFARSGTTWSLQQKLSAADGVAFDNFGIAVAISGDTAVVGNVTADPQHQPLNQAAYVFVRTGTTWSSQDKLMASDAKVNDSFGSSVAVSGDTALVGASGNDFGVTTGTNEGAAYLFVRSDGSWSQQGKLTASDHAAGDLFGYSVALSGTAAIVGAPDRKIGANFFQGEAYPFVNPDADGDGLPDDWEKNGVTIGGKVINLRDMGADPMHKDLFVHVDWMQADPSRPLVVFKPNDRAIKMVIDAFAVAPVDNPDHKKGIRLHVDVGTGSIMNPVTGAKWGALSRAGDVPFQSVTGSVDASGNYVWANVDTAKGLHFDVEKRSAVFHYALFCNDYAGSGGSSGLSRGTPAADFILTLGTWSPAAGTVDEQAGTLMHELGHNLGLRHGGDEDLNFKPNYVSIMNYVFQLTGLLPPGRQRRFDYSAYLLSPLNETSLDEGVGIDHPLHYLTLWNRLSRTTVPSGSNKCVSNVNGYNRLFLPSGGLDWDCDGVKSVTPVAADINGDGACVSPGVDGIADTAAAGATGDDDVRGKLLWSGPNRMCETAKIGDDVQENAVGYVEAGPVLTGFKDWPNLVFEGGGKIGSASGASSPDLTSTPISEPTMEQLLDVAPPALLDEEPVAPLDEVTVSTQEGPAPLMVDFDASASTAVNGTIVDWAWDFGDGTTGSGAMVPHTYDTPGDYFASVTVTDSNGNVNLVPLLNLITVTDSSVPTPTPTATAIPLSIDHFVTYGVQTTKGTGKFLKFGPVTLGDAFGTGGYDIVKEPALAVPADKNGEGITDAATHLVTYAVKAAKGSPKASAHIDVHVVNQCGETWITAGKPVSLLVPTALDLDNPVAPPNESDHNVGHFLCYQAKQQKNRADGTPVAPFAKGVQADVTDHFQTRRYDLKKVVQLCNPVSKSGSPVLLAGPAKGAPLAITPATIRNPESHLVCYQAKQAKKLIVQNGCGPVSPTDKGAAIVPPQAKHVPRLGMYVANQFGPGRLDTQDQTLLCIPSSLPGP
jgi:PKD repeat protein